jgi:hypothetical protein
VSPVVWWNTNRSPLTGLSMTCPRYAISDAPCLDPASGRVSAPWLR